MRATLDSTLRKASFLAVATLAVAFLAPPASAGWWWHYSDSDDLFETLQDDGRFTTLVSVLEFAELDGALAGDDDLTVFAPTDEAFAALPADLLAAVLADRDLLTTVLLYHVTAGKKSAKSLAYATTPATLQTDPVLVLQGSGGTTINGAGVIDGNIRASNGYIHAIDSVLLPPEAPVEIRSLVDVLAFDGRFTTLIDLVIHAGLAETLITGGPFTVLAPTDDAFGALDPGTIDALKADVPTLQAILLYHVIGSRERALSLYYAGQAETLQGSNVHVSYSEGTLRINGAAVINYNARTPNGIIHVLDQVLLPPSGEPETIVDTLLNDGRFSILVAALQAAGLDQVLADAGPLTVFAPTDAAFGELPEGTVEALLADPEGALTDILLYHVVDGKRSIISLWWQRSVPTLAGDSVHVRWKRGKGIVVNNQRVLDANIATPNGGYVHAVDGVLLP